MISATDLFTPAPSGVGPFGNVPPVPVADTYLGWMLTIAGRVQLPTTSWQSGAPERTILAIEAVTFAESDVNVSLFAQGAFLQTAAIGYVVSYTLDGAQVVTPVTPDPSNAAQNPTGAAGWLDLLTQSTYLVTRLQAAYCKGPLAIVNLKGSGVGPYAAGSYHVGSVGGATYANQAALSVPSSAIAGTGGVVAAVYPGPASTLLQTVSAHGVSVGSVIYVLVPSSSGVTGLSGVFALVTATTAMTLQISLASSGTWSAGGSVYLCTVADFVADVVGIGSNAPPGTVTVPVTQVVGLAVSNVIAWAGSNWESNTALVDRTLLSLASRSPNGPSQAYQYFAETAAQLLAAETPPYTLTNGPVLANAFGSAQFGIETIVVASQTPASTILGQPVTPGCAQNAITGVSNTNPCVVSCASLTSLAAGQSMTVAISGVVGTAGVNGAFTGTYVSPTSFSIPLDTTLAGAWIGGGQVEGGDLGQIDALIQQNVTPDNTTSITVSALALPVTIAATVAVPQAYVATYRLAVGSQLQAQIASYPMGGTAASAPAYTVPWEDILAALEEAGVLALGQPSYVESVTSLVVSGNATTCTAYGSGVPFPSNEYQAILASYTVSVVGV